MINLDLDIMQEGYMQIVTEDENKYNKVEKYLKEEGRVEEIVKNENIMKEGGSILLDSKEKSVFIKNLNFEDYKNLLNIINGENGTI